MSQLSMPNIIYVYGCTPIAIVDIFVLLFSIVVLARIRESQVFVYFKFENIFTLLDCTTAALFPLYKCKNCFVTPNPSVQCTIEVIFYNLFSSIFEMTALMLGIMAALAYLSSFSATNCKSNLFNALILKTNPVVITIFFFVVSFLCFSYVLFEFKFNNFSNDTNIYECEFTDFGDSTLGHLFFAVAFSISNGLLVVVVVLINLAIVHKVRVKESKQNDLVRKVAISKQRRTGAEKKLTMLILIDCLNLVVGRLPFMVFFTLQTISEDMYEKLEIFNASFASLTYFTFFLKFIIFYSLNNRFKKESNQLFAKCLSDLKSLPFGKLLR